MAATFQETVDASRCWHCIPLRKQLEIQTYILAVTSGLTTNPSELAELAAGFEGLSFSRLTSVTAYLLGVFNAAIGGGASDPDGLAAEAACYQCVSHETAICVQTYMLSLDERGPGTTDPDELQELAKCFCGLSTKRLLAIQAYLLGNNSELGTDPDALAEAAASAGFDQLPAVVATAIRTAVYYTVEVHYVGGIGPITPPGPCIDTTPVLSNPGYGNDGDGNDNVLLTFDIDVGCVCEDGNGVSQWNIYSSPNADGSNATFWTTVANTGGTHEAFSMPIPLPDAPAAYIYLTQQCQAGGTESAASNILPLGDPTVAATVVTDWDTQVQANGGAALSVATKDAATDMVEAMIGNRIWARISDLCVFAPDNLIAAITPIKVTYGLTLWTNHNFAAGDLTKYGLIGDGASKYLETGVTPTELGHTTSHASCWTDGPDTNGTDTGTQFEVGSQTGNPSYVLRCWAAQTGSTGARVEASWPYETAGGLLPYNRTCGSGYMCATRSALTLCKLYYANRYNAHTTVATNTTNVADPSNITPFFTHATNNSGAPLGYSKSRIKAVSFGASLTEAQSNTLYESLKVFREGVEDGTQTDGEYWATQVQRNGGAAPAAGTVTAIDTFLAALESANILDKMLNVTVHAPDSTIAARTPVWRAMGFQPASYWVTELSVDANGMYSGGSRITDPGFYAALPFTNAGPWPGLSIYVYENINSVGALAGVELGGPAAMLLFTDGTNIMWDCFNATTDRTIIATGGLNGFWSGNRTASNLSKIFHANSTNAFSTKQTNSNAVTGTPSNQQRAYYFGYNNGAVQNGPNRRLSFIAVHFGLTATEAEALYNAVQALRTSLGGGYV